VDQGTGEREVEIERNEEREKARKGGRSAAGGMRMSWLRKK
jgi:hypothetical protein